MADRTGNPDLPLSRLTRAVGNPCQASCNRAGPSMRRHKGRHKRWPEQRTGPQPDHRSWFRRYRYHLLIAVIVSLVFVRFGFDALLQTSWMERRYSEVEHGMTA